MLITSEEVKEIAEQFPVLITREKRIRDRLVKLVGKDPEQEYYYHAELEAIKKRCDLIFNAIDSNYILTNKENAALFFRTIEGCTLEEIGNRLNCTRERARQLLESTYKKISTSNAVE